jgi:hypothetical protein
VKTKVQQKSAITRGVVIFALAVLATLPLVAASETEWPNDVNLAVELKLTGATGTNGQMKVAGNLTINNPGNLALSVESPKNRFALAFVVFDSLGNLVAPKGLAKVDPAFQTQILSPGASFNHHFESLDYLSGSALFGYELNPEAKYSIVAVYRPAGLKGPGFATREFSTAQVTPDERVTVTRPPAPLSYRDPDSGIIILVESDRHHVAALDRDGKILWCRQPATDGNLPSYSASRPTHNPPIVWIGSLTAAASTGIQKTGGTNTFAGIRFNSRQGGALDLKNGDFTFLGQD